MKLLAVTGQNRFWLTGFFSVLTVCGVAGGSLWADDCTTTISEFIFDEQTAELTMKADTCCVDESDGLTRCNGELPSSSCLYHHWYFFDYCEEPWDSEAGLCNFWGYLGYAYIEGLAFGFTKSLACIDLEHGVHELGLYSGWGPNQYCNDVDKKTTLGTVNIIKDEYEFTSFRHRPDPDDPRKTQLVVGWRFIQAGSQTLALYLVRPSGYEELIKYDTARGPVGELVIHTYEWEPSKHGYQWKVLANPCHRGDIEELIPYTPPGRDIDPGGNDVTDDDPDRCEQDAEAGAPVRLTNGNMRYTERLPLATSSPMFAEMVFDTTNQEKGLFGQGWSSFFENKMKVSNVWSKYRYQIETGAGKQKFFDDDLAQSWPASGPSGELSEVTVDGADFYAHLEPGGRVRRMYRTLDGRLTRIEFIDTNEVVVLEYPQFATTPRSLGDQDGSWSWAITRTPEDSRKIGTIVAGDSTWTFQYEGDYLISIEVDGALWRTYTYDIGGRLIEVTDGEGFLIESHFYDPETGRAITSRTPNEHITNIEYNVDDEALQRPVNGNASENVTRVTWASGRYTDYYIRPMPSAPNRVVEIRGDCDCAGAGEFTSMAYDGYGRVIRRQDALGYIAAYDYDSLNRLIREERGLWPADCDPTDYNEDPTVCRLSSDELASAALNSEGPLQATDYTYDDLHPAKVATVCRDSVVEPGSPTCDVFDYDPLTGATVLVGRDGFGWSHETDAPLWEERHTTWTLYGGGEGAAFDPTEYQQGIEFESEWAFIPQPDGLTRAQIGSIGETDLWVFYPDAAPPHLRGRLAARLEAAGDPSTVADDLVTVFDDYDEFGNLTRIVDPRGVATRYEFDGLGRLVSTVLEANCDPILGFDEDPLCGVELVSSFDYLGTTNRKLSEILPGGGVTVYGFEPPWGRLKITSRGSGVDDLSERIKTTFEPDSGAILGQALQGFVAGEWLTTSAVANEFDAVGRLERTILPRSPSDPDPAVETMRYDASGRIEAVTQPGRTDFNVGYRYDALGRLIEVTELADLGVGHWISTIYDHDAHGNLVAVTDANGNQTNYDLDDFGSTYRIKSPVTGVTRLSYDAAGRIVRGEDARGAIENRSYDEGGQIIKRSHILAGAETETSDFIFEHGFQVSATTGVIDESWSWGRRGLPLTYSQGAEFVRFEHDENGALVRRSRGDCEFVKYHPDWAGRPTAIIYRGPDCGRGVGIAETVDYLPFGPVKRIKRNNLLEEIRTYDWQYRLTDQLVTYKVKKSRTLVDRRYTYNIEGNLASKIDRLDSTNNHLYSYDDLSRLVSATGSFGPYDEIGYQYDDIGSRVGRALVGGGHSVFENYTLDGTSPVLTSVDVTVDGGAPIRELVQHDPVGNLVNYSSHRFEYGAANRLLKASGRGPERQFDYRSDGQMVSANHLKRLLLSNAQPIFETTGSGGVARVYLGEILLASITLNGSNRPIEIQHLVTDHIGFPLMTVTAPAMSPVFRGTIPKTWEPISLPFGEVLNALEPGDPSLRFPGQWQIWDQRQTWERMSQPFSLIQNGHRWYKPGWGRYGQGDPIGLRGGVNVFVYSLNNPLRWADPSGLRVSLCCAPAEIMWGLVDHCWIKTDSSEAGLGNLDQGQPAGESVPGGQCDMPFIAQTQVVNHAGLSETRTGTKCKDISGVEEECVNDLIWTDSRGYGAVTGTFTPTNNCQSWANDVLDRCRVKCKDSDPLAGLKTWPPGYLP